MFDTCGQSRWYPVGNSACHLGKKTGKFIFCREYVPIHKINRNLMCVTLASAAQTCFHSYMSKPLSLENVMNSQFRKAPVVIKSKHPQLECLKCAFRDCGI